MLAESNSSRKVEMRKEQDKKCSTSTACMSSDKIIKYQIPLTEKITLPVLTEPGQATQIGFFRYIALQICNRRTLHSYRN